VNASIVHINPLINRKEECSKVPFGVCQALSDAMQHCSAAPVHGVPLVRATRPVHITTYNDTGRLRAPYKPYLRHHKANHTEPTGSCLIAAEHAGPTAATPLTLSDLRGVCDTG